MRNWFKTLGTALRDSLWFLPALLTLASAALAILAMAADAGGLLWSPGEAPWWVYQGEAQGARSVLQSLSSGLITVTGVVFSMTMVAVQLASSQYTPRVLRDFTSDRGNQLVFGTFISTFVYSVLVLRTIRSPSAEDGEFVPRLAVTGAVALTLVSVGALIYFINHLAREIHVTALLDRIALETRGNVHKLFPEHIGHPHDDPPPDPREPENSSHLIRAEESGYVHFVDEDNLFDIGERERMVVAMEPKIGSYVLPGRPLASVSMEGALTAGLEREIREAFVLGPERTPEQDVEFGMIQISDIAIKTLSPAVNDPTTAIRCIDRLSQLLAQLGTREPPEAMRTRDGRVCFVASYTTFEDAIKVAYDGIRHFGAGIPMVAEQLLHTLAELAVLVEGDRIEPILEQARAVLRDARREIESPRDLAAVEEVARQFSVKTGHDLDPEASDPAPGEAAESA